jgi:drug/metabolite transporter (DMT)-like permease
MTPAEWIMLIALSTLFGSSFFFVGVALKALPPLTLVLLRVGLAAVILHIIVRMVGVTVPYTRPVWLAFVAAGFLNNVLPFCLIVWGQTRIASGLAAILIATTPLWTVVVAHFFTADEKMTGTRLAGALLGFLGVAVMVSSTDLSDLSASGFAQVAVLGAALSYAFAGVFGRRFRRMEISPLATAAGQVTTSAIMLLPIVLLFERPWLLPNPDLSIWAAVLGIAVFSTALAYVLYFRILSTAGATNLLLVTLLAPVSAILLGAFVLGERLEPRHFAGMAMIGCGLAVIDGRLFKRIGTKAQGHGR